MIAIYGVGNQARRKTECHPVHHLLRIESSCKTVIARNGKPIGWANSSRYFCTRPPSRTLVDKQWVAAKNNEVPALLLTLLGWLRWATGSTTWLSTMPLIAVK